MTAPWSAVAGGVVLVVRLTPKGGRNAIDGMHPLRVFFRVTLPLIKPALMVAVIFRLLDALRMFDLVYVMSGNSRDTMSMSVYARQQLIDFGDLGFGSAAATLIFAIIALFTVVYLTVARVGREAE